MCTINMTFEVPEAKHINIEVLKQKINAMVMQLIANPNAEVTEKAGVATPQLSQRLRGIAKAVPADFDYKKELASRL